LAATVVALMLRGLEGVGGSVRRGTMVALAVAALMVGVVMEGLSPATWRPPTIRAEFRRALRQALAGGLGTVLLTAALVGFGMVYQALYWLSVAGQQEWSGRLLVTVLVREVAPALVGLILLGRSGTVSVAEYGKISADGQLRILEAQGLDPFRLLVLPRTVALAIAGFTLGMVFLAMAVTTGVLVAELRGGLQVAPREVLENLVDALNNRDFPLFAVKMVVIGVLVALTAAVTGMSSTPREEPGHLLPRAFVRGLIAVLVASALLTVVVT
jgi:phospholipid/cholesterol/gamma-HCH transport system permease protein